MYVLSRVYVEQNGYRYYLPCPLVIYKDDILEKMKTQSAQLAMAAVALENNIQLIPTKPIQRPYTYGPPNPVRPTTGSISNFILGESVVSRVFTYAYDVVTPTAILNNPDYSFKPLDGQFVYTNTASKFVYGNYATLTMTYALMKTNSPLLYKLFDDSIIIKSKTDSSGNIFYPFTSDYPTTLPCICYSVTTKTPEHSGFLTHDDRGNIVFYPAIHKALLYLYQPFLKDSIVFFSDIGCPIDDLTNKILYKYTKKKLNQRTNSTKCYRT